MPEIDHARYQAVYQYVLGEGSQVNSWPNTASIIAMAIEVALNFKADVAEPPTTTNN